MPHAISYCAGIFSTSLFALPEVLPKTVLLLILVFLVVEWLGREGQYAIERICLKWPWALRYAFYYAIVLAIVWFDGFGGVKQQFIYFQF